MFRVRANSELRQARTKPSKNIVINLEELKKMLYKNTQPKIGISHTRHQRAMAIDANKDFMSKLQKNSIYDNGFTSIFQKSVQITQNTKNQSNSINLSEF
jgi:hypothetical protein